AARSYIKFGRHQHSEWGRSEVKPDRRPVRGGKRRADCASGIHAHSRDWRFDADVNHHEKSREQSRIAIELWSIGYSEDDRHQQEGNDKLRQKSPPATIPPRRSHDVIHGRMSQPAAKHNAAEIDT